MYSHKRNTTAKTPDKENLPILEREVCVNLLKTTISPSDPHKFVEIDNPFKGKVKTNLMQFYISRFQKPFEKTSNIDLENVKKLAPEDKYDLVLRILNDSENSKDGFLYLNEKESSLCKEVILDIESGMAKIDLNKQLKPEEIKAYNNLHSNATQILNKLGKYTPQHKVPLLQTEADKANHMTNDQLGGGSMTDNQLGGGSNSSPRSAILRRKIANSSNATQHKTPGPLSKKDFTRTPIARSSLSSGGEGVTLVEDSKKATKLGKELLNSGLSISKSNESEKGKPLSPSSTPPVQRKINDVQNMK